MGSPSPDPLAAETELLSLLGRPELSSQLLETVPGGVVVVSLAGGVMHANAEAQRLLGLTYESLTGRYVTDWATQTFREDGSPCPPEDYPVTLCLQSGERQGPTTIGIESPEGELTWCVFMAVPLHAPREGHLLGAVVSFLDVTSRRQVEQDLRVSEARYRSLVRHIQDTVIIIDRDERILFINNVTVGFSLEDLLGTSIRNFMPDPSVLDGHSEKVFQEGQATVYETDASNGRWYRSHLMPLERDAEGTVLTAMLIASDVTESRREEEDRHRLEADLARRVSELNVLAGGIAHDFNNVLQGILGSAELAMRLLPEDHELRSHLEDIRTDARHAGDLTHQLLAYSGRGQVCIEPLDLEELLTSMWRLVRANVSRRAKLTLALEGDLGVVEGDATQLRQVVMNLATNASEALGGARARSPSRRGGSRWPRPRLRPCGRSSSPSASTTSSSRSATKGPAWTSRSGVGCSIPSSRPSPARGAGWGWPRCMGSCARTAGPSPSTARLGLGPRSGSSSPSRASGPRPQRRFELWRRRRGATPVGSSSSRTRTARGEWPGWPWSQRATRS